MEIGKWYVVLAICVGLFVGGIFDFMFPIGFGLGYGVCMFIKPYTDKWWFERQKRNLVKKREELRRLEAEVAKHG